jgi:hypothetical protein
MSATHEARAKLAALTCTPGLSFAKDIAPLFNATDIAHMKAVANIDLSNCESVTMWAHAIYQKIESGQMPPYPADPLSPEQVNTFGCWLQQGCQP